MPNVSLRDVQLAIKDSIGSDTYDSNEIVESKKNYYTECDIHSLIERRNVPCSVFC